MDHRRRRRRRRRLSHDPRFLSADWTPSVHHRAAHRRRFFLFELFGFFFSTFSIVSSTSKRQTPNTETKRADERGTRTPNEQYRVWTPCGPPVHPLCTPCAPQPKAPRV